MSPRKKLIFVFKNRAKMEGVLQGLSPEEARRFAAVTSTRREVTSLEKRSRALARKPESPVARLSLVIVKAELRDKMELLGELQGWRENLFGARCFEPM
jgi:hypothetical protein